MFVDIKKLRNALHDKTEVDIKTAVALVFTEIDILNEKEKLEIAAKQMGANSEIRLIIIGADGMLTFGGE